MTKKLLALLMVLAMVAGVLAGCGGVQIDGPGNVDIDGDLENYTTPNLDGKVVELYMPADNDFEAEGSYTDQVISKTLNMDLKVFELDNFDSQYNPMLIEGDIPDLTMGNSWSAAVVERGEDGAMIDFNKYLDKMPNVKAFLESNETAKKFVEEYTTEDGTLYALPIVEPGSIAVYGYIYRKDVFAANNMTFPTTQDAFYNTLKQLKTLYPDSYPFVMRQMTGQMQAFAALASQWGICHQTAGLVNTWITLQNGKYIYAPATSQYKELVTYVKGLLDEKLMHPSSMTMDTAGWTEAFASNTSFIGFDKMDRMPSLNTAGTAVNPDFKLVGAAPIAMGSTGRAANQALAATIRFYQVGVNENLENTLKYVDWLYSEEGQEITNWGIEGESFEVVNGEKKLIASFVTSKGSFNATGLSRSCFVGHKDFNAYLSTEDEDFANSVKVCLEKTTADPQVRLTYSSDDQFIIDTYANPMNNYGMGQMAKFIMGQRDISEWDTFVSELKDQYHLDDLIAAHERAYAELTGK